MTFSQIADNSFLIDQAAQFRSGTLDGLLVHQQGQQAELRLAASEDGYQSSGSYLSPVIKTAAFRQLILSWNGQTPQHTYIELQARVSLSGQWSAWLSWGKWGTQIAAASVSNDSDPLAFVDTDTLIVKHAGQADQLQIRAFLHSTYPVFTPKLNMIAFSLLTAAQLQDQDSRLSVDQDIDTPAYAQLVCDPKLAAGICSPTTLTMAMNRLGENLLVEEVAYRAYDYLYQGFGNWSFNMALAGSYGFRAYTVFTTIDGLKKEIAAGYPLGVSVQYTPDASDKSLPYVENAYGPTHGHLLLVRGFQTIDGVDYVLVNDPFAAANDAVVKKYKLDQFRHAWVTHMAYIIHGSARQLRSDQTSRLQVFLRPTHEKNVFALYKGGQRMPLPAAFTAASASLAYTLTDQAADQTLAAEKFYYTHETKSGDVYLDWPMIKQKAAGSNSRLTLYVITRMDKTYVAEIPIK